jgi:hypothetical protein
MTTDQIKASIQDAQGTLGRLQMQYTDNQSAFWALAVAWEATRFAWYVADHDEASASDKLASLKVTIADYERMTAQSRPAGN